jgi:hypothetical protein
MIERATFEKIATMFQQAYEQMKTKAPTPAPENVNILDALQQIKASIVNLEDMQTARNEPKTQQRPTIKSYADTLKPPSPQPNHLNIRNSSEPDRKEFSQRFC